MKNVWDLYGAGQTNHQNLSLDIPVFFNEPVHIKHCEFYNGLHLVSGSVIEECVVKGEFTIDGKPWNNETQK